MQAEDLAAVSEWLGHARVTATRLYDKRIVRVENSFGTPGDPLAVKSQGPVAQIGFSVWAHCRSLLAGDLWEG